VKNRFTRRRYEGELLIGCHICVGCKTTFPNDEVLVKHIREECAVCYTCTQLYPGGKKEIETLIVRFVFGVTVGRCILTARLF